MAHYLDPRPSLHVVLLQQIMQGLAKCLWQALTRLVLILRDLCQGHSNSSSAVHR